MDYFPTKHRANKIKHHSINIAFSTCVNIHYVADLNRNLMQIVSSTCSFQKIFPIEIQVFSIC